MCVPLACVVLERIFCIIFCRRLRRIVAAVSLDASMILELLSPLAPAYFLPIASIANVGTCDVLTSPVHALRTFFF